jgi:hypothetical protein
MPVFYTGASGTGTGEHLHFSVHDVAKGSYIDPTDFQDILMTGGKPLTEQFSVTSPYGNRRAPTAVASTFHQGIDYATPTGTPVSILNGTYLTTFDEEKGGRINQYAFTRDGKKYEALLMHGSDANKVLSPSAVTDGISEYTGQAVPPTDGVDKKVNAKERATNYANMSKSQLNAEYDKLRSSDSGKAQIEGMKMHKAFFRK